MWDLAQDSARSPEHIKIKIVHLTNKDNNTVNNIEKKQIEKIKENIKTMTARAGLFSQIEVMKDF